MTADSKTLKRKLKQQTKKTHVQSSQYMHCTLLCFEGRQRGCVVVEMAPSSVHDAVMQALYFYSHSVIYY